MSTAVRKSIVLPVDLARRAETWARAEGKSLSDIVQDALRQAGIKCRIQRLRCVQSYWCRKARNKGILTEKDLAKHLCV